MKSFMKYDFNINKISLVCYVHSGDGVPVHINRPNHGLVLYTGGKSMFTFDNKKIYVKKNDLIYLPKSSNYIMQVITKEQNAGCYAINFDLSEQTDFSPFVFSVKDPEIFTKLFKQSEFLWRTKASGFQMECKANLYKIICKLRKEFELGYIPSSTSEIIDPAIAFIHENYTGDNINISHLAELCKISEPYFRRIFKQTKGVSPLKYINNLKISRAKELLSSCMYSVSQVSEMSGFHDESYFSREYKKATGTSPSEHYNKSNN